MTEAMREVLGKRFDFQEQLKHLRENGDGTDIEQRRLDLLAKQIDKLTLEFHRLEAAEFEAKRDAAQAHCQGPYVL